MVTDKVLRKFLMRLKFTLGFGLTGIFLIMKSVFDYRHIPMGIGGYIAFIIGIGNIIWVIYDYIMLRKNKNESIKIDN